MLCLPPPSTQLLPTEPSFAGTRVLHAPGARAPRIAGTILAWFDRALDGERIWRVKPDDARWSPFDMSVDEIARATGARVPKRRPQRIDEVIPGFCQVFGQRAPSAAYCEMRDGPARAYACGVGARRAPAKKRARS